MQRRLIEFEKPHVRWVNYCWCHSPTANHSPLSNC